MTKIYLVRHAHSTYTPDEFNRPLSEQGYQDATGLIELMKDIPIDIAISSPYKRAIETIEPVCKSRQLNIIKHNRFRERLLSAEPVIDFQASLYKLWHETAFSYDGGESNQQAQKSAVEAIFELLEAYTNKNIIVGTHGNTMVLIMQYFDKTYDYQFWKSLEMPAVYEMCFETNQYKSIAQIK